MNQSNSQNVVRIMVEKAITNAIARYEILWNPGMIALTT
jgi:hypothetical protein